MKKGYKYTQDERRGAKGLRTRARRAENGFTQRDLVDIETFTNGTTILQITKDDSIDRFPARVILNGHQARTLYIALRKHYKGY